MESLTQYQITEKDYVRAYRLASRIEPLFIGLGIGVLLVALLLNIQMLGNLTPMMLIGAVLMPIAVFVLFRGLINPIFVARHYQQFKTLHDPIKIAVNERGLRMVTTHSDSVLRWERIRKWRENEDYMLLYPNDHQYHILPKQQLMPEFDTHELAIKLEKFVGKAN